MPIEYDNGDTHFYDNFGEIVTKTVYPHWAPYILLNGRVYTLNIETQNRNQALAIRTFISNNYVYYVQTLHLSQAEEIYWMAKNGGTLSTGTTYLGDLVIWNSYRNATIKTDRVKNFRAEWTNTTIRDTYGGTHPGLRRNADGSVDYTVTFIIGTVNDFGISGNKLINSTELMPGSTFNLNNLILSTPTSGTSGLISGSYTENQYTTGFNGYVKIQDTWKNNNVNFYVKKDNSVRRFNYMWVKSDNVWRSIYRNTPNTINITN